MEKMTHLQLFNHGKEQDGWIDHSKDGTLIRNSFWTYSIVNDKPYTQFNALVLTRAMLLILACDHVISPA